MERKKGLDFVRVISAFGIVAYHFYCHSSSAYKLFLDHANGAWGVALNYLFFALSGLVLHLKYAEQESWNIKAFYYKRWKSMLPAYWIVFLYVFSMNVFAFGKVFYLDIPKSTLVLTLIGMDGYVKWVKPTYHAVGEWFLGAVLVAYAVYPVMRRVIVCRYQWLKYAVLALLVTLYAVVLRVDCGGLPAAVNPVVCLLAFFIGNLLASKFSYLKKKWVYIPAAAVLTGLALIPMGGSDVTKAMIVGLVLLVVLYNIGEGVCKWKPVNSVVSFLSVITYPVFLLHHNIIYMVLGGFDTVSTSRSVLVLLAILVATVVFSKVLDIVMKAVFQSRIFTRAERVILNWCYSKSRNNEIKVDN